MTGIEPYKPLYKKIGYTFEDATNLEQALTHRSAGKNHNERLEFLGDAVLGMIIADELYKRFPDQPEGSLTRMRSSLVKGETLSAIGLEFELGSLLKLGPGELKSGGHRRASILEDAVEAIIGAIYLEAGIAKTQSLVLSWFAKRLDDIDPNVVHKDSKTRLQEYLQGRKLPLPSYTVVDIKGKDHQQTFVVECQVKNIKQPVVAQGSSRRKAEQDAAKQVLELLTNDK